MITRITHLTLFVKDQAEALDFYVNKLGFKVHTDHMFDQMRWLTICPSEQPDMEIALMLASTPEQKLLVGKQAIQVPLFSVATNDCQKTYQELTAKDVKFLEAPKEQPWGISAIFLDLYGNIMYLCQQGM